MKYEPVEYVTPETILFPEGSSVEPERVRDALEGLPFPYQTVLLMSYYERRYDTEIAEALELSSRYAARSLRNRAEKELRYRVQHPIQPLTWDEAARMPTATHSVTLDGTPFVARKGKGRVRGHHAVLRLYSAYELTTLKEQLLMSYCEHRLWHPRAALTRYEKSLAARVRNANVVMPDKFGTQYR